MNKKKWAISIAASVLLVVAVVVAVFGTGYRFFVVETPSMATTAPVGTLVVVHPKASYAVGDIVSYQAKNSSKIYTHRIVDQTAQGWITKGDLNGAADPLPVTDQQIVGSVDAKVKYVGFFVRGLPWIVLGFALVYGITLLPRVRPSWRWQIRLIGWSLVLSIVALWIRPWVNLVMTGYVPGTVGVDMHLVNTGIFPVDVLGTVLRSGEDATVNQTVLSADGKYHVTPTLALTFWWFVAMLAICISPMVFSLFVRPVDDEPEAVEDAETRADGEAEATDPVVERASSRRRLVWVALTVMTTVLAVAVLLQATTQAALSAAVTNSTGTAGTRTWFSCQNAETGTAGTRFVWGLTATGMQSDLSGHTRNGTMTTNGTAATASASSPCPYDTQGSVMLNGGTCFTQGSAVAVGQVYSEEVWFKTTNTAYNGKLMGLADTNNPSTQSHYDRHVYIDQNGRVIFGAYTTQQMVITSPAGKSYADGVWHHVVVTSNATTIALYLDGNLISSRSDTAGQDSYTGYWQVGCGLLNQWQDANGTAQPFKSYFTGNLRLAAVYDATLTAAQVKEHYIAGTA